LRSVRATWWCTAIYLLVVGGTGWLAAAATDTAPNAGLAIGTALTGFGVGQGVLVVLGALAVTSEFSSGMLLVSLTAVPRRGRLLVAKTLVVAAWCALLTLVLTLVCALAARTLTTVPGGIDLLDAVVLRSLGLQVGTAALVAVLAVGLGAVLRTTAGAVGAGLALVMVLPPALALADGPWPERLSEALPALRVGEDSFLAAPTSWQVGMAVLAAWAVVAWALGAVLLARRDV
jgi:ABC-2 type transport system permease protein